jgi:microcystin-dependent protein
MMKSFLLAAAVALSPSAGWAASEPFIGEIDYFPYTFCPVGYMPTDGRVLSISSNTALFSLIENRYGGSAAQSTFALPMLKPLQSETGAVVTPCIAVALGVFE